MPKSNLFIGRLLFAALVAGCGDEPARVDTTPPAVVSDLSVVAVTDSSVTLAWTAPGDDGTEGQAWVYDLRVGLTPAPTNLELAPQADSLARPQVAGSSEWVQVGGLLGEEDYYFALRTTDEAENWSSFSPVVTAHTTADTIPPAAVTDLTATALSHKSVALTWTAPGDSDQEGTAAVYETRYAKDPITDESWADATVVTNVPAPEPAGSSESLDVDGLDDLTTYYFALKTTDDGLNQSALSNVASTETLVDDVPPATVSDLAVASVTYSTATLTWTAPGDDGDLGRAAAYDIRYAETPVTEATWDDAQVALVDVTPAEAGETEEATVTRLVAGRTYYFALVALDERGNRSGLSNDPHATLEELFGRVWRILADGSGDAPTIQAGIDRASVGDTVLVAPGTYTESIDFKGKDIVVVSSAGPEETVIQGTTNDHVVSFVNGEGFCACLSGFTVTGGWIGIRTSDSEPVIGHNYIVNNSNDAFGAGIHCYSSHTAGRRAPLIEGNRIAGNTAGLSGAGIFVRGWCTPTIKNNTIEGNTAVIGDGGAMYLQPELSGLVVTGNACRDNLAGDKGGAVYVGIVYSPVAVEVSYNLIVNNRANGGHHTGFSSGGIALRRADAWVHHNTLVGNSGYGPSDPYGGSIAMDRGGSPVIEKNIIAYTVAGGAIRCLDPTTVTIRDNLVWENVGGHGSGTCTGWWLSGGNMEAAPQFCDPADGNYTLAATSPAFTHPAGPLGAFPSPGCSTPPAKAQTWGGIQSLYRP